MRTRRNGFTLLEVILSLSLSTLLLAAVSAMLLSQGKGINQLDDRAQLLEQSRGAVDLISAEISDLTRGSVIAASADSISFRLPIAWGVVCGDFNKQKKSTGSLKSSLKALLGASNDTTAILLEPFPRSLGAPLPEGFALSLDGVNWSYHPVASWASLDLRSDAGAVEACTGVSGATGDYKRFVGLSKITGSVPSERALMLAYIQMAYAFRPDESVPGALALYRGGTGRLQRLAGPFRPGAAFTYRLRDRTQPATVSAADLSNVELVRVSLPPMRRDKRVEAGSAHLQPWIPLYNSRR